MNQKSILLILPYFGKWPIWFEAHLKSIAYNDTVNWLIVTDCELPKAYPSNIKFVVTDLKTLNEKVNNVVEANVPLTPRKFCDLKPAYGDIFKEYIAGFDFWGFCDMDIIWGDIRKFITNDVLAQYDIISSRKEAISGHFNLFRNTDELNILYKQVPNYKSLFEEPKFMWFDEEKLTNFIKQKKEKEKIEYSILWNTILLNQEKGRDSHQEYYLDRWLWDKGKMINTKTEEEVMYLHFINWKRTIYKSEVEYLNTSQIFYTSYIGFHYKEHHYLFKLQVIIKNIFYGYYIRMWKKRLNKRLKGKRFFY